MKYQQKSFSVTVGSDEYRDGWEKLFGKGRAEEEETTDKTEQTFRRSSGSSSRTRKSSTKTKKEV